MLVAPAVEGAARAPPARPRPGRTEGPEGRPPGAVHPGGATTGVHVLHQTSALLLAPSALRAAVLCVGGAAPALEQWASLVAQTVKNLPVMQETWVPSLVWEDPLEEKMATHSSILAWKSHQQRSLVDCSPWGCKESDKTEAA